MSPVRLFKGGSCYGGGRILEFWEIGCGNARRVGEDGETIDSRWGKVQQR